MNETKWTSGPWEYIASTEHHGPYVVAPFGGDIADCYTMSNRPIHFQHEQADANARLIAAAPDLYEALADMLGAHPPISKRIGGEGSPARRAQEDQEAAIAKARAALARAKGAS